MLKHRFLINYTCNQIGRSHLSPATRSPKWRPGRRTGHTNIKELACHAHRLKRQSHTGRERHDSMKTRKKVSEKKRISWGIRIQIQTSGWHQQPKDTEIPEWPQVQQRGAWVKIQEKEKKSETRTWPVSLMWIEPVRPRPTRWKDHGIRSKARGILG